MSREADGATPRAPEVYQLPPTSWTLLALASGGSSDARSEFAQRYYRAIRAYIARLAGEQDADDLVQGFFEESVLSGRLLSGADRHKGQFRAFLKASIRHYVVDAYRRRTRKKAQPAGQEVRPDGFDDGWNGLGAAPSPGADDELLRG